MVPRLLGRQQNVEMTSLGHSCLQLDLAGEEGPVRLVIDPGSFSGGFPEVADAVLLTHRHADHLDPAAVAALAAAGARVIAEAGAAEVLTQAGVLPAGTHVTTVAAGETLSVGGVEIETVGGRHGVIHPDIPRIGNVGFLVRSSGRSLFHPGDAYEYAPDGVEILAVPLAAPWAAVKETVAFVRAVRPEVAVPIHDALLTPAAREIYLGHVRRLGRTEIRDLTPPDAVVGA
jgi:L-ascorbate metabolism protein UlaG (beta-lactamase superfamily)